MSELKPCPFCGGDAELHHDYSSESGDWYVIDCLNNGCMRSERSAWEGQQVSTGWRKTKSEAIEAWNTRAERTCKRIVKGTKAGGWPKEVCSKCGAGIGDDRYIYCWRCGAKVVGHD